MTLAVSKQRVGSELGFQKVTSGSHTHNKKNFGSILDQMASFYVERQIYVRSFQKKPQIAIADSLSRSWMDSRLRI